MREERRGEGQRGAEGGKSVNALPLVKCSVKTIAWVSRLQGRLGEVQTNYKSKKEGDRSRKV